MKRLLVLVLAVLLPLQLVWGAAAAYCGHEAKQRAHVGHHAHVHKAEAQAAAETATTLKAMTGKAMTGKAAADTPQLPDLDCQACHAGSVAALPVVVPLPALAGAALPLAAAADLRRPSAPQRAPDRPQWPRLA